MDDISLLYILHILSQKSLRTIALHSNLSFHIASVLGNEIAIIGAKNKQEIAYMVLKFYYNLYFYEKYGNPKLLEYLDNLYYSNLDYRDPTTFNNNFINTTGLDMLEDLCSKKFENKMEKDFSKFLKKQYKELLSYQDPKFKKFVYEYLTNHPNFKLNTNSVKEFDLEKLTSFELFKLIQNESNLLKIYFAYLHLGYLDCLANDNSDKPENISLMFEDIDKIMKFLNKKHKGGFSFIYKPFGFRFKDFKLILIDQPFKTEEMVLEIINNNSDISPFEVVEKLKKKKLNISSNIDEIVESYINEHPDGLDHKIYQSDLSKNKNQFLYKSDLYNNNKKDILRFISNDTIILPTQEGIIRLVQVPEKLTQSFIDNLNILPHKYIQYPYRPLFRKDYLIDDLSRKLLKQITDEQYQQVKKELLLLEKLGTLKEKIADYIETREAQRLDLLDLIAVQEDHEHQFGLIQQEQEVEAQERNLQAADRQYIDLDRERMMQNTARENLEQIINQDIDQDTHQSSDDSLYAYLFSDNDLSSDRSGTNGAR
jgi:hypothetical protein